MRRQTHLCVINLQFTKGVKKIMKAAARIGRQSGRDHDFVPDSFEEAAFEILCFAEDAEDDGVKIILSSAGDPGPTFPLKVCTYLNAPIEEIIAEGRDHDDAVITLDDALAMMMTSDGSPADMGFEIDDIIKPKSAHAKIASLDLARKARIDD